jgi:hypothetical protein
LRMKFDNNTSELVIALGDNWDGVNGIETSEKSENHIWWAGIWLENMKFGGSNVKLFRNDKWAIVVIKMNLKYLFTFASKDHLLEEYRNWNISREDLKAYFEYMLKEMMHSIFGDIESWKLKREQGDKLLDQYCNF